jgi:LysM repeat protein
MGPWPEVIQPQVLRGWHRSKPWLVGTAIAGAALLVACGGGSGSSSAGHRRPKASVSTTSTTAGPISYTVQRGDTLTSIGHFFGLSVITLADFNHISTDAQLMVGQTLQIPRRPAVRLTMNPSHLPAGDAVEFDLVGARGGETVTFQVVAPGGGKFTGPGHFTNPDGSVRTSYQTSTADHPGTYTVTAAGDLGTMASATFRIDATSPSS